jgi:hypothetical protein
MKKHKGQTSLDIETTGVSEIVRKLRHNGYHIYIHKIKLSVI